MPVDVDAVVVSNVRLSDDYNVITFHAPALAARVEPGQFVMVKAAAGLDPFLRRPFSIFELVRDAGSTPSGFSLLNKQIGAGTRCLSRLQPGERVPCLGPLGRAFDPVSPPARAWMVAGGVGLAPFVTLAESLRCAGVETTLFYGARRADELFSIELFERLDVRLVLATEDGSRGEHGRVTRPLARYLDDTPPTAPVTLYACGPTPMLRAVAELAGRHRRAVQVSLEQVMGCGLGGCYSCVVPVRNGDGGHFVRSCIEGPVFDGSRVLWDRLDH